MTTTIPPSQVIDSRRVSAITDVMQDLSLLVHPSSIPTNRSAERIADRMSSKLHSMANFINEITPTDRIRKRSVEAWYSRVMLYWYQCYVCISIHDVDAQLRRQSGDN